MDREMEIMIQAVRNFGTILPANYARYCSPPAELVAKNPQHWEWAKGWTRGSVVFSGPEGTGKSSLARHLVCRHLAAMDQQYDFDELPWACMDLYAPELEQATRDTTYAGCNVSRGLIERAMGCGLLLLDDIDRAQWREAGLNALRAVINHRHEREKMTLTTTNLSPKDLTERMVQWHRGDRDGAMSLLRRLRPAKFLQFQGDSYRVEMKSTG